MRELFADQMTRIEEIAGRQTPTSGMTRALGPFVALMGPAPFGSSLSLFSAMDFASWCFLADNPVVLSPGAGTVLCDICLSSFAFWLPDSGKLPIRAQLIFWGRSTQGVVAQLPDRLYAASETYVTVCTAADFNRGLFHARSSFKFYPAHPAPLRAQCRGW